VAQITWYLGKSPAVQGSDVYEVATIDINVSGAIGHTIQFVGPNRSQWVLNASNALSVGRTLREG
jgi:hypothetical protein